MQDVLAHTEDRVSPHVFGLDQRHKSEICCDGIKKLGVKLAISHINGGGAQTGYYISAYSYSNVGIVKLEQLSSLNQRVTVCFANNIAAGGQL